MFVAIEGPDGSGKTTQVKRLLGRVKGSVEVPGCSSSPLGKFIRRALAGEVVLTPDEMQSLYTADRHAREKDLRALRWPPNNPHAGPFMVADRWTLSGLVYGSLHLEDDEQALNQMRWVERINYNVERPDLYVVLDVNPEVVLARLQARFTADGGKREIYERDDLIPRIIDRYVDAIPFIPGNPKVVRVNAVGEADAVADEIWAVVSELWPWLKKKDA